MSSKNLTTSRIHHNTYLCRVTSVAVQ